MIIAIEGIDGTGKSTVAELLSKRLFDRFPLSDVSVVSMPGTTELGNRVHEICHTIDLSVVEEQLLMTAADSALHRLEISPALDDAEFMDSIIIMDRWNASSRWAYSRPRGIDRDTLVALEKISSGFAENPDAFALLDAEPDTALRRKASKAWGFAEMQGEAFLSTVRGRYLEAADRKLWTSAWQVFYTEGHSVNLIVAQVEEFILEVIKANIEASQ